VGNSVSTNEVGESVPFVGGTIAGANVCELLFLGARGAATTAAFLELLLANRARADATSVEFLKLLLANGVRGTAATVTFLETIALGARGFGATVAYLEAFVLGARVCDATVPFLELFALGGRGTATTVALFKLLLANRARGTVAMAITTPSQETIMKYAQTTRILDVDNREILKRASHVLLGNTRFVGFWFCGSGSSGVDRFWMV
jgi:hypothetical protein